MPPKSQRGVVEREPGLQSVHHARQRVALHADLPLPVLQQLVRNYSRGPHHDEVLISGGRAFRRRLERRWGLWLSETRLSSPLLSETSPPLSQTLTSIRDIWLIRASLGGILPVLEHI